MNGEPQVSLVENRDRNDAGLEEKFLRLLVGFKARVTLLAVRLVNYQDLPPRAKLDQTEVSRVSVPLHYASLQTLAKDENSQLVDLPKSFLKRS